MRRGGRLRLVFRSSVYTYLGCFCFLASMLVGWLYSVVRCVMNEKYGVAYLQKCFVFLGFEFLLV